MIPDFQKIMLPFMSILADGLEHSTLETNEKIARLFELTDEEINQFLPSGAAKTFPNRVAWAKSHLKMAGLLENTKRSYFRITESGKKILEKSPHELNLKVLKNIPTYQERTGRVKDEELSSDIENTQPSATPKEILENSYLKIRKNLAQELLLKIKNCSPSFFESLV